MSATIKIDWMKNWGNSPRIILEGISVPEYPSETDPIWEKSEDGLHIARKGEFVFFFYTDGKPTQGFGGRRFAGTFTDGSTFEYKGAWSSRAGCVNQAIFPYFNETIVEVIVGYCVAAVTMTFLSTLEMPPGVFLEYTASNSEPVIEPTYLGSFKGDPSFVFPE
jgi:hypothetical protein